MEEYYFIIHLLVNKYFIINGSRDDLIQEGRIGLYNAIKNYSITGDASFKSFVYICVERQIQTVIKLSRRKKHAPLNYYVSLTDVEDEERHGRMLLEVIENNETGIEDKILNNEYLGFIKKKFDDELTDVELGAFKLYLQGYSYKEISEKTNQTTKRIDNAIQRSKRKISKTLEG